MITYYFKPIRKKHYRAIFNRGGYGKSRKIKIFLIVAAVGAAFLALTAIADIKVRPIVKASVGNALKNKMTLTVNDAVSSVLSENSISYTELVSVEKDNAGAVTSITSDSVKMNLFKSDISKKVSEYIEKNPTLTVNIPWGTLTGSEVLSGRGGDVKINAELFGFTVTDFKSSFESAGINQTRHSLYITVRASAYAHAGAVSISESIETDILIAETVIVGGVPYGYFSSNEVR